MNRLLCFNRSLLYCCFALVPGAIITLPQLNKLFFVAVVVTPLKMNSTETLRQLYYIAKRDNVKVKI